DSSDIDEGCELPIGIHIEHSPSEKPDSLLQIEYQCGRIDEAISAVAAQSGLTPQGRSLHERYTASRNLAVEKPGSGYETLVRVFRNNTLSLELVTEIVSLAPEPLCTTFQRQPCIPA